ncbi:MAG: RNA ligase family protein [Tannerella sp.]|nr:RNA ligase family protein [Tannerella sp.]
MFTQHHLTYHKINSLYKREMFAKNRLMIGDFSQEEFEYLYNNEWICTEKIDGTNVFCYYDPNSGEVEFHGKTSEAEMPAHLYEKMRQLFTVEKLEKAFPPKTDEHGNREDVSVWIYGEGYGMKIQKGGNYISRDCGVILFDVKINNWWLKREDVEDIASKLELPVVPIVGIMTLADAEKYVREGFKSIIAENRNYDAEGLVCVPKVTLFDRAGRRVIVKIKTCDYRH